MAGKRISYDYTNLMAASVGTKYGVADRELKSLSAKAKRYAAELADERSKGQLPFMDLPYQRKTVAEVKGLAKWAKGRFDNLVVLGIGGSALGCTALQTALNGPYFNLLDKRVRKGFPRVFVLDNVDPDQLAGLLRVIDVKRTLFNVITKSGSTVETMSQFVIVRKLLGRHHKGNIVLTTDPEKGILRDIAERDGYRSLPIPPGVGGRFSVLTPVGLFPAAASGIPIDQLLAGAAAMDRRCRTDVLAKNPAFLNAALHFLLDTKKGKNISVMMPYSAELRDVADWYRQLWAESLGKENSLTGRKVYCGQTPVKALGVTDQHSQNQLYVQGPFDKVIAFLEVGAFRSSVRIPKSTVDPALAYMGGHSLGKLMEVELAGTRIALTRHKRPNCTIKLPSVCAHTIGQLFYMLEMQTAFAGKLYRIDPFDQPGVEAAKNAAYALLGRQGYEAERKRITAQLGKRKRRID